jgi:hypothetical protein
MATRVPGSRRAAKIVLQLPGSRRAAKAIDVVALN